MSEARPAIWVTEIGEYIRQRSCERRFKLEVNRREMARQLPFASRLFAPLDPVLAEMGRQRENTWEASLRKAGLLDLSGFAGRPPENPSTPWAEFLEKALALQPGQRAYGREIGLHAPLGAFDLQGRVDFALILWNAGRRVLRLVECKASRRDRTFHRIQVALYRRLVRELLQSSGDERLGPGDLECVVARIDEESNQSQDILALEPLDLDLEESDVERLLAPGGRLHRVTLTPLDELDYQLDQKCDGCVFNVCCLPETARQRRIELLGLDPSTSRLLRGAGLGTLDELATADLQGPAAASLRGEAGFTDSLELLRARARTRRRTLPGGDADPEAFEVEALPYSGAGQLPEHEQDGQRLVRIYLGVDYDYSEGRIGALSAHVTMSPGQLDAPWAEAEDGRFRPGPELRERRETGRDAEDRPVHEYGPLRGAFVCKIKSSEWCGDYQQDSGAERELIQSFLHELVEAVAETAEQAEAPIHFYVWSHLELTQLVESCSRVSSRLLGNLRELLGCRESLEQLIASSLQEEVDQRYALGWTGRGLTVVASLRWFGRRYHWRRRIAGVEVDLDEVFAQDIFDFVTRLDLAEDGAWALEPGPATSRHRFEVRSRFQDGLSAPYWRAFWRTLPDPATPGLSEVTAQAIRRYERAKKPAYLREYLKARAHALRWIEEGIRFKNPELRKPVMAIDQLPDFTLGVDSTARAALDFLRLDQHIKVSEWLAAHLQPPATRVPHGRTLPLRDLASLGKGRFTARIHLEGHGLDLRTLESRSALDRGSFVRVSPCSGDPNQGQTLGQLTRGGKTCALVLVDWETGQVFLDCIWGNPSRYTLSSTYDPEPGPIYDFATVDESVSDFVASTVDERLEARRGVHVFRWFDPETPQIPLRQPPAGDSMDRYRELLGALELGSGPMAPDQAAAALDGLGTRVQLIQGPPGTGKTMTTAVAILLRILARGAPAPIVLVAANTHTAVDTLLLRLEAVEPEFRARARQMGLRLPPLALAKVNSARREDPPSPGILSLKADACAQDIGKALKAGAIVVGGTTNALLKMAKGLADKKLARGRADGFGVPVLVVDEASMMVFPHFLALGTLVEPDGEILLSGDHRQLSPILAHDWEREDRPPAVLYQPFASAYRAVQNIIDNPDVLPASARRSALRFTFRLPPILRRLIGRVYRPDDIQLEGLRREAVPAESQAGDPWRLPWASASGLFLALHTERQSRQSNPLEAEIIERLLSAAGSQPPGSIAVVTPHRAQRALLKLRLAGHSRSVDVIDTVERLQGNERPTVIVSATASDSSAISSNVEFLLNLNRSNVAFSRARDRLIVVCSETLLDHIPVELEQYESAMLWKALRAICSEVLVTEALGGATVRLCAPPGSEIPPLAAREAAAS